MYKTEWQVALWTDSDGCKIFFYPEVIIGFCDESAPSAQYCAWPLVLLTDTVQCRKQLKKINDPIEEIVHTKINENLSQHSPYNKSPD